MKSLAFALFIVVASADVSFNAPKDLFKPVEPSVDKAPESVPEGTVSETEHVDVSARSFPTFPQRYNYNNQDKYKQKYNPFAYRPYEHKHYKPSPPKSEYVTSHIDSNADILKSVSEIGANGYNYEYETRNGIAAEAHGILKTIGNQEAIVVQGSYRYTAPDSTPVFVTYIADENGYQPHGNIIPQVDGVARYTSQRSADA